MKYLFPIVAAFTLSACLDVDDSSNDTLVAALEEQNEILQQQLEANTVPINVFGEIYNVSTDAIESSYEITVTVGGTVRASQLYTAGTFRIENLPQGSDYSFVVSSPDNSFMDIVVFDVTPTSTINGDVERSIGRVSVAQAQEYNFAIKSLANDSSVPGLLFKANSHQLKNGAQPTGIEQHMHTSSYNETSGIYSIVLPEQLHSSLYAKIDEVESGTFEDRYTSEYSVSNQSLTIQSQYVDSIDNIYLTPDSEANVTFKNAEFRVSVFDDEGNIVPDLELTLDDEILNTTSTFDEATQQYVLTGQLAQVENAILNTTSTTNEIRVLIPAFALDDKYYQSSYFRIYERSLGSFYVSMSGAQSYNSYEVPSDTEEFNLVIQPNFSSTAPTNIEVVFDNLKTTEDNFEYSVFFSQPIAILDNGYSFVEENQITVVRGNESEDDLYLPGTTAVSSIDKETEVTATLSLSNTLLTFTSPALLTAGDYQFNLNQVLSQEEDETDKIIAVNKSMTFTIDNELDGEFSINDLVLDNGNYLYQGERINTTNTNGEIDNSYQSYGSAYIYFPSSINTLQTLTLNKVLETNNGVLSYETYRYEIVRNGYVNASNYFVLDVAGNENVVNCCLSVITGTTIEEGYTNRSYYSVGYLYDNTDSSKNSVTFNYAYETLAGEVESGQIELFVH